MLNHVTSDISGGYHLLFVHTKTPEKLLLFIQIPNPSSTQDVACQPYVINFMNLFSHLVVTNSSSVNKIADDTVSCNEMYEIQSFINQAPDFCQTIIINSNDIHEMSQMTFKYII